MSNSDYRVVSCNMLGESRGEFVDAEIDTIVEELNEEGACNFSVSALNPNNPLLLAAGDNEIQIYRNGVLKFWGVPIRWTMDSKKLSVQCAGLMWYFKKRFVGQTNRFNWLSNGSFESPLAAPNQFIAGNWSAVGVQADPVNDVHILGPTAMRLTQASNNVDTFLSQNVSPIVGQYYTVSAWVYMNQFNGPAYDKRGLFIIVQNTVTGAIRTAGSPIDETFETGQMYRLQAGILVSDPNEYLQIRLYAPGGVATWDACTLTLMESISNVNQDQAKIVNDIVYHSQGFDTNGNAVPSPGPGYPIQFGKSDLNIKTNCPPTGVLRTRVYQHADHQNCHDILNEFVTLNDGVDYNIVYGLHTRTFTTYFPRKGNQTPNHNFRLEIGKNIQEFTINVDNDTIANSIIVLGGDNGPGREEGGAVDTSYTNGVIFEKVFNSLPGTKIDALPAIAQEELRRARKPITIPQITTTPNSELIDNVFVGDVIPVNIVYGALDIVDSYRIVRMEIHGKDDSVTLTLNTL